MQQKILAFWHHPRTRMLTDVRNIGLYIFALIVLAITWSGINTIQVNYALQRKIATLQQENAVSKLENENIKLKNEYYKSDQFLELAARRQFGKASPGERVYSVPKTVAMKYIDQSQVVKAPVVSVDQPKKPMSKTQKNLQDWRNFLLGRPSSN